MAGKQGWTKRAEWGTRLAVVVCLGTAMAAAQNTAPKPPSGAPPSGQAKAGDNDQSGKHITPEQAKQLFALVDELIQFSSQETGLPVKSPVKRQLTTRNDVEKYLDEKFDDDESAKRLQRDEIVLKKFGLLDRDFALLTYVLRHASPPARIAAIEKSMLEIDYRLMRAWYRASSNFSHTAAHRALNEMSIVVAHFANSVGERLAGLPAMT